jgi:hypothetical protein
MTAGGDYWEDVFRIYAIFAFSAALIMVMPVTTRELAGCLTIHYDVLL